MRIEKAIFLVVASTALLVGCASTPDKLIRSVERGDFESIESLAQQLESEEEVDEVRDFLRMQPDETITLVETQYGNRIDRWLEYGHFQSARETANNGLTILPGSIYLEGRLFQIRQKESDFNEFVTYWIERPIGSSDFDSFLSAYQQLQSYEKFNRNEHSELGQVDVIFDRSSNLYLAQALEDQGHHGFVERFGNLYGLNSDVQTHYGDCNQVMNYQVESDSGNFGPEHKIPVLEKTFNCYQKSQQQTPFSERDALNDNISGYLEDEVPKLLLSIVEREPDSREINLLEEIAPDVPEQFESAYLDALAEAHMGQARKFVGLDLAGALSVIHAHRAEKIRPALQDEVDSIISSAMRSVYYASEFEGDLVLNPSPNIDPDNYDLMYTLLSSQISERTVDNFHWNLEPRGYTSTDRYIEIDRIRYYHPDFEQLDQVASSFHSHNEQVENSSKRNIGYQIDGARRQLNSAESRYNSAVNMYNISPTNFNYNSAQSAYRNYQNALAHHNNLVRQYNSMPDYVSRPVYQSYFFLEGYVRHGWEIDIVLREPGKPATRVSSSSVESAFTRVGTHYADVESSLRRDIPHDLDLSDNRALQHLSDSMGDLLDSMEDFIGDSLELTYTAGLSEFEQRLLRDVLHPWGVRTEFVTSLAWVDSALDTLDLAQYGAEPLTHTIARPGSPTPLSSAEYAAGLYSNSVVLIEARSGSGSQNVGMSSGAIVREDGLILTTAHGLPGNELTVVVGTDSDESRHPANILQINHQMDVALLKIEGTNNQFPYMPLDLSDSVSQGEAVFAMGNPSLGSGLGARNAITQGVVAQSSTTGFGAERLVLDIAVASGSSGGPVISSSSGRLVGIVTSVVSPESGQERAASGSFALAAPASNLSDWLGLRNSQ